jgi:hypothetical protein
MMMFSPVTDTDQGPTGDKADEWVRYLPTRSRTQQQSVISLARTGWTFTAASLCGAASTVLSPATRLVSSGPLLRAE